MSKPELHLFFRKPLFILLFLLMQLNVTATHIVGGELYYKYIGNNNYEITLLVYRDCFFGVPPFDDPGFIGIWDANNTLLTTVVLSPLDSIDIPNEILSPCFVPPVDVCYRRAMYRDTMNLPPLAGGYQLAYQRCCRNNTIVNIVSPLSTGATFYASIPGTPVNNSNPVFVNLPPPFVCAGLPYEFDHHAIDAEGDSLVYEICTPFDGASMTDPLPIPANFPPPFNQVIYNPPYNISNQLGGVPLTIDPQTGILTATPNTIGQFVIGVCVNEYRNGVLLSKTRRDYQLNVEPCPTLVVAALQYPNVTCGSYSVSFTNNSFGASTYFWDFGDPATNGDTSHVKSPGYVYPDTGTYYVTLIAYSTFDPDCADTIVDTLLILPEYIADFDYVINGCSNTVSFNDSSNSVSGVTNSWSWNFGDGSPVSTVNDPVHTYTGPGNYTVTLTATSARGCVEVITKTITIPPRLTATASNGQVTCFGLCTGQSTVTTANASGNTIYLWSDPAGQTTQTASGLCPGTYTVTVTDSAGCVDSTTAVITSPQELTATTSATDAYCAGLCIGTATINISGGTPPMNISWNDPQSQTTNPATYLCPGWYTAVVTDSQGCTYSDSVEVIYSTFIPPLNAQISDSVIFEGETVILSALPGGNITYSWTPVAGLSNPFIQNPSASPLINTTYYVTITDQYGCTNTDSVSVAVRQVLCEEPEIFIPNAFTPGGNDKNDILYVRGNTIRELTFRIFDRWGEKVFESNDPSRGWDGYYKGKLANPAVYVYYVEAVCYDNQKFYKQGNITLIR